MNDILECLREELKDREYSEAYAESFLDSYIASQIKVLREQHKLSQKELASLIGTGQSALSRIENVNYSKWNVTTLKKIGRAFRVRVKVSFETYGSLLDVVQAFSREGLERVPRELDPVLHQQHPRAPLLRTREHFRGAKRSKTAPRPVLTFGSLFSMAGRSQQSQNQVPGILKDEHSSVWSVAS